MTLFKNYLENEIEALEAAPSGASVVHGPFSLAFNTPNIDTGVTIYTATAGDYIVGTFTIEQTAFDQGFLEAVPLDPNDVEILTGASLFGPTSGVYCLVRNTVPMIVKLTGGPANSGATDAYVITLTP